MVESERVNQGCAITWCLPFLDFVIEDELVWVD